MCKYLYLLDGNDRPKLPDFVPASEIKVLPADASQDEREAAIAEAEVIFGQPEPWELKNAKRLRWLQLFWAGADRYLDGTFPKGVQLTNAAGAFGAVVAEHALAMLLALCRRLPAYKQSGQWDDLGCEKPIAGGTAMVFGCGDIGTELAKRLQALGVRTIGVCRDATRKREGFDALTTLEKAENLLPEADFVLSAIPNNAQTKGYFSRERIARMKQEAIFVNVGRGATADTDALAEALASGKLFGVGLDVTEPEPLPQEHPLWAMPNVILTPHVAGVSFGHLPQVEEKIWNICAENLRRYLSGEPLRNRVLP